MFGRDDTQTGGGGRGGGANPQLLSQGGGQGGQNNQHLTLHKEEEEEEEDKHQLFGYSSRSATAAGGSQSGKPKSNDNPDLSQPESEESLPLMQKIHQANTLDLILITSKRNTMTDVEVQAAYILKDGTTRSYDRTHGSRKKE